MKTEIFYSTPFGRALLKTMQKTGVFHVVSWFLHTRSSKCLIPTYIKKYNIDMRPYKGQKYKSFASFFSRKRDARPFFIEPEVLISPCDGLLSVYAITPGLTIPMKGSIYELSDLLPDREVAARYCDGLCLVFRLEASDYHHFCCFDDGLLVKTKYIPGQLHSVQPIAHRQFPVFRLNRRWWSILETQHFGTAVQIEVGALLVGDVSFSVGDLRFNRGEEMGNFELAGSSIVLLLDASVRNRFRFRESLTSALDNEKETRIRMGEALGALQDEE